MVVRVGDDDEGGVRSGSFSGDSGRINCKVDIGGLNQRHTERVVKSAIPNTKPVPKPVPKGPDEVGCVEAGKQQHFVAFAVRDKHLTRMRYNDDPAGAGHHELCFCCVM